MHMRQQKKVIKIDEEYIIKDDRTDIVGGIISDLDDEY